MRTVMVQEQLCILTHSPGFIDLSITVQCSSEAAIILCYYCLGYLIFSQYSKSKQLLIKEGMFLSDPVVSTFQPVTFPLIVKRYSIIFHN